MGQVLFWLEAAITSVLFVALGLGILPRIQRRLRRWVVRIVWIILAPLPWVVAIGALAAVQIWAGGALFPLISVLVAGGLFATAAVVVIRRGRRPTALEGKPIAAHWRLSRLSLAWGAGVLLTCMTFWNLDLAVRQKMATMRVEAGAIALSVSPPRIPDSQNAAVLYRQAWDILDAQKSVPGKWDRAVAEWLRPNKREFNPNDEQMLAFLNKQAQVIDLLHRAGQLSACNFGIEYYPPSVELVLPRLAKFRDLSRLMCLSTRVNVHEDRLVEAMKDLSTCFAMADHCRGEPPLIASLVAFAVEDQAFGTFQYVLDQDALTNEGLNALRLNPSLSFNAALHSSMRMENAFAIAIFTMLDPSAAFPAAGGRAPCVDLISDAAHPYRVFLWEKDIAACLRWMRRYERLSAQPYYENRQEWNEPPRELRGGLLATIIVPSFSRSAAYAPRADAQHGLALLAVAMWRYRLERGVFPDTLDSLVPKYSLSIPVDPFTGQGMKLARTSNHRTMVYSVGPDLEDDGGTTLDKETNKGDIVLVLGK